MQPPDELMAEAFLPAMRQLVAARLRSQGLSQNRISGLLGITQASVSMYLSSGPGRAYSFLSKLSVSRDQADRYSDLLADDVRKGGVDGIMTLNRIWTSLLGNGSVCAAHREMYPSLSDCDFCIKEYGGRAGSRSEAISEVAEAVRLLEESPTFVEAMPEVSVNIACAPDEAASPADVIAIPGRIVRVRDRAKATLPPEAGASIHMANVLLIVRRVRPDLKACINLRYNREMAAAIRKLNLKTLSLGAHTKEGTEDSTARALQKRLKVPVPFDAIVDEGGSGIEPNVYLFAAGAKKAAEIALKLSEVYSAA